MLMPFCMRGFDSDYSLLLSILDISEITKAEAVRSRQF